MELNRAFGAEVGSEQRPVSLQDAHGTGAIVIGTYVIF